VGRERLDLEGDSFFAAHGTVEAMW